MSNRSFFYATRDIVANAMTVALVVVGSNAVAASVAKATGVFKDDSSYSVKNLPVIGTAIGYGEAFAERAAGTVKNDIIPLLAPIVKLSAREAQDTVEAVSRFSQRQLKKKDCEQSQRKLQHESSEESSEEMSDEEEAI